MELYTMHFTVNSAAKPVVCLRTAVALLVSSSLLPAATLPQDPRERPAVSEGRPYRKLTNDRATFTNFNVEVVRGFAIDPNPDAFHLYAVNAHASTVVHHRDLSGAPDESWRTVANPVSVAFSGGALYVVGQGNHALARHDLPSGKITDVLMLRSEPSDIVIDEENGWAWISCMGDDSVVQVDLDERMSIIDVWDQDDGLRLKRPRFLTAWRGEPGPHDNGVLVAPMLSGNNTFALAPDPAEPLEVIIADGRAMPGGVGLPDEDLFRILPRTGAVEPIVRGAGSLMMGHGRHPITGDYWMLGVEEHNADPSMPDEPSLRGRFATNVLAIVDESVLADPTAWPVAPQGRVDLDDWDPSTQGAQYAPQRAVSFPYAIAFDRVTGLAAIASATTPMVILANGSGQRSAEFPLTGGPDGPSGKVARSLGFRDGALLVYCQQTGNILVFDPRAPGAAAVSEMGLGPDPTPAGIANGRDVWYDATRSQDGRTSCNTCHPQGGTDGIAWQLSDLPVDYKDPSTTQPLLGISDTFPYHWRGERDLAAFNAAFPGLLGASSPLSAAEMDDFRAFVFSLTPPANPLQTGPARLRADGTLRGDFDRRLKDSLIPFALGEGLLPTDALPVEPTVGSVLDGDVVFHDVATLEQRACASCHAEPTGSNGDFTFDAADAIATKSVVEVAQLAGQLSLKRQPLVEVQTPTGPVKSNLLGFGLAHDGSRTSLLAFNSRFELPAQRVFNLTAFMHLFDSGTAPAVHFAARVAPETAARGAHDVERWLLRQAPLGWVGCVAFGTAPDRNGMPARIHWYYDPELELFVPEDAALSEPRAFTAFTEFESYPFLDNVFLGVPPGNEHRLGVDFDGDGLDTGQERVAGSGLWVADSDGDSWPDGYEVAHGSDPRSSSSVPDDRTPPVLVAPVELDFVNAAQAKFFFATDEPTTWEITCRTLGGSDVTAATRVPGTIHTAVVRGLDPSTTGGQNPQEKVNEYVGALVLTDLSGNRSAPIPLPGFESASMLHGGPVRTVVGDLSAAQQSRDMDAYQATLSIRVDQRELGPPSVPVRDQVVVGQLLAQAANGRDWEIVPAANIAHTAPASDFLFGERQLPYGSTPGLVPGPFLVLRPTTPAGLTRVTYRVHGLAPGQAVMFNVLAVIPEPDNYDPAAPAFPPNMSVLLNYQMPATAEQARRFISTL